MADEGPAAAAEPSSQGGHILMLRAAFVGGREAHAAELLTSSLAQADVGASC